MSTDAVRTPRRRRSSTSRVQTRFAWLLLAPAILTVFGVVLFPLYRTVLVSLFDVRSALDPAPAFIGLGNYIGMLQSPSVWASLGRTFYFTVVSLAVELVFGLALALLLNAPLRARWLFRTLIVIPWAIPTIVNAAMWRGIFNAQYGALNALLTQLGVIHDYVPWLSEPWQAMNLVILADAWKTTPLVAFFLLAGLTGIPHEIYEAAAVDGLGWWKRFRAITLPLLVPAISIVVVLRTVEAFKVFDIIYAMTRGGPANGTAVISYYTYVTAFSDQNFGMGSAMAMLIVLAIAVLCLTYLRLIRTSDMSLL
ncbi:carbohydrate ABC transporter permease [Tessaracoccus antarcticus]|uniref:Sugar ABC transporter permease n=1 Tax=Tessaracoccus antarcticus TaxID=2479848 RepID=A0A3M0G5Q1_9ACTN|nr:sugar ABC transporter permease [Tessaracoccus antarcticus]RMB60215.1 sugar ABC transporter permease [Tessaracoccus antarcticus]